MIKFASPLKGSGKGCPQRGHQATIWFSHGGRRVKMEPFLDVTEEDERREREKARELRQSRWWKTRVAGGICHYCGRKVAPKELTLDHLVPVSRGGKSTKNNCVPACKDCNNKKKHLLPMEWKAYLASQGADDAGC